MDIEKINRNNFRSFMNALAFPGRCFVIEPINKSYLLSAISVFVFSEASYYVDLEDKNILGYVDILTNGKKSSIQEADYIFLSKIENFYTIQEVKIGDFLNPEKSAVVFLETGYSNNIRYCLSGPGVNGKLDVYLPIDYELIKLFLNKNKDFPLGIDMFILTLEGKVFGLPRTINIEVE